jgi:hypothetical protein
VISAVLGCAGLAIASNSPSAAFVIFGIAGAFDRLILGVVIMDLGTQAALISNQARIYSLPGCLQSQFEYSLYGLLSLGWSRRHRSQSFL